MASLLIRIREMVTAQAHHSLDQVENPHVMAQQVLRDLSQDLHHAQRALVTAMGAEKSLERGREQLAAEAAEWQRKAEKLVLAGSEELARSALERAVNARSRAQEQERPLETARKSVGRMREQVERLRSECESARARAAQISANHAAAQAMGVASQVTDHYTRAMDRSQRLDQLARKASSFEAEVEAASELLGETDRLEREIAQVDTRATVDVELAALKARMAASSTPA
ncbi:MAG TPA: PspA/IM30 family protein [Solimonas sp.]|nr:PspA/IM30 family protein [Solimonas sp.]